MDALLLLLALCCQCNGLPLVTEDVDEIAFVWVGDNDFMNVVFVKDGRALATRLHTDDMVLAVEGETFRLHWEDYYTAERIVSTKRFGVYHVTPLENNPDDGVWWAMARPIGRDLKQP